MSVDPPQTETSQRLLDELPWKLVDIHGAQMRKPANIGDPITFSSSMVCRLVHGSTMLNMSAHAGNASSKQIPK